MGCIRVSFGSKADLALEVWFKAKSDATQWVACVHPHAKLSSQSL